MKIFVDETGWIQLLHVKAPFHRQVAGEIERAVHNGDTLFTHNIAVGEALSEIKKNLGSEVAGKFTDVIEEAYTGAYLNILWIGRRTQKEAVRMFRRSPEVPLGLYDFAASIFMKRRRIRMIITTKKAFAQLGLKVLPEPGE